MNKEYVEMLKEVISDPENLTPERLQTFLSKTLKHLFSLRETINSTNPEDKELGLNSAEELKGVLEGQMEVIAKMVSLTPDQLIALSDSLLPKDSKEGKLLSEAKEQFLKTKNGSSSRKKKITKKKKNIINLVG